MMLESVSAIGSKFRSDFFSNVDFDNSFDAKAIISFIHDHVIIFVLILVFQEFSS